MSRKKVTPPKEEPKNEPVKKELPASIKKWQDEQAKKKAKEAAAQVKKSAPVVTVPVTSPAPSGEKQKKPWDGLGLIGTNEQLNIFKGKIKMKGGKLGEVLYNLIKGWNEQN